MNKIKWIFFDIGNVINDESSYNDWLKKNTIKRAQEIRPEITEQNFDAARVEASKMPGWLSQNILEVLIGDRSFAEKVRNEMNPEKEKILRTLLIRQDAQEVIKKLSQKYSLGTIANQPSSIKDWLQQEGIIEFFKVLGLSGDYNLQKPNPEFFKAVLKDAGAKFEESAMIDDNIERSLDVANQLGMTTVFFNGTNRQDIPKDIVDFTIYTLTDLLSIF